jgi:hypothetical protein
VQGCREILKLFKSFSIRPLSHFIEGLLMIFLIPRQQNMERDISINLAGKCFQGFNAFQFRVTELCKVVEIY